jgi:hypothetical protein
VLFSIAAIPQEVKLAPTGTFLEAKLEGKFPLFAPSALAVLP